MIDFAVANKLFHKNGQHRDQDRLKEFSGNSLFACDSMVSLLSTGRKDDLESLFYILCFLYRGTLPVIKYINTHFEEFEINNFLDQVIKYRRDKMKENQEQVKEQLPGSLKIAFSYITSLKYKDKPDYNLIKLYLAQDRDEE